MCPNLEVNPAQTRVDRQLGVEVKRLGGAPMRSQSPADAVPGPTRDPDGALPGHVPATAGLPGSPDAFDPGTQSGGPDPTERAGAQTGCSGKRETIKKRGSIVEGTGRQTPA